YRTPKKTNWIAGSKRTKEQKGKPGRKAGGTAYKVRREGWRILANKGHIAKLLEQSFLNPHERKPTQKFPLRIPDLSEAVEEIIIQEIWPKLAYHREHVVNEWLGVNGLRSFLQNNKADNEILEQFSKGVLEEFERNRIIHLICKRNWRAILARWIELKVFSENLWKEDHILIALSKSHDIQIEPQSETTKVLNKSIDFKCAPFCNKPEMAFDFARAELWCANCGFIGGKISFSFNSITQEEIYSYEYYDELEED
ncbi:TFIIB-type zinc ribbon-containing protein, partial [Candidatus Poseidoniaceae archaeon]|nr:TFIIB-type zinc ribbon-containing protein [Candidatus Poseidoniaceae archaeon]